MSKKALLVGINQFIPSINPLHGCVNDTIEVGSLLKDYYGFQDGDMRVLNDAGATKQGIIDDLTWLFSEYEGGGKDVRVFHFSSHGSQVDDQSGDEWDCRDEVIVPYDHSWDAPFRDDDLRQIFDTIPEGVNFTFIADCCHSGTIQKGLFDTAVEFTPRYLTPPYGILDRIDEKVKKRDDQLNTYVAEQLATKLQGVPPDQWAGKMKPYLDLLTKRYKQNNFAVVNADQHVLLAACEDRQTAADAHIGSDFRGAFTWSIGEAVKEANGNLTYDKLIKRAAAHLKKYDQKPQLECPPALRQAKLFSPLG